MQILKPWLLVCVAVCALSARGADNDSQAKAREALQKLQGSTPQPAQAQPAAPQTPAPPPAQSTPPPPTVQPTSAPPPATAASANDEAIAKAREAMHQKMQEVAAPQPPPLPPPPAPVTPPPAPVATQAPPPTTPTPPPPAAPPPPVVPPPVVPISTVQAPVEPALPTVEEADPAAIAKAREAERLKMQQLQAEQPEPRPATLPPTPVVTQAPPPAQPPPPAPVPPVPAAMAAAPASAPPPALPNVAEETGTDPATIEKAREAVRLKMQTMPAPPPEMAGNPGYLRTPEKVTGPGNFPPLTAPPLPISTGKQQLLDQLLVRYKADQITPEQYQAERAKILAAQ